MMLMGKGSRGQTPRPGEALELMEGRPRRAAPGHEGSNAACDEGHGPATWSHQQDSLKTDFMPGLREHFTRSTYFILTEP